MLRNSRCSRIASSSSADSSSPAMGSSSSVIGRPSMSPSGMPVSAMKRSEIQVSRPSASVSKIQSELASATSRNRSSLSTMACVEDRLCRSADQPKATNSSTATHSDGAERDQILGARPTRLPGNAADWHPVGSRQQQSGRRLVGGKAEAQVAEVERTGELRQPLQRQAAHHDQHIGRSGRSRVGPAGLGHDRARGCDAEAGRRASGRKRACDRARPR